MIAANDLSVRRALEAAGIEFMDGNGGGRGYACANGIRKSLMAIRANARERSSNARLRDITFQAILARESAVGVATIRRAEPAENQTSMTAANDIAIRRSGVHRGERRWSRSAPA
jgi:hypothetical protein